MERNFRIGKLSMFLLCLRSNCSYLIMFVKMFCLCSTLSYFYDLVSNLAHMPQAFSIVNEPLFLIRSCIFFFSKYILFPFTFIWKYTLTQTQLSLSGILKVNLSSIYKPTILRMGRRWFKRVCQVSWKNWENMETCQKRIRSNKCRH